jgi:hypothetical protein
MWLVKTCWVCVGPQVKPQGIGCGWICSDESETQLHHAQTVSHNRKLGWWSWVWINSLEFHPQPAL